MATEIKPHRVFQEHSFCSPAEQVSSIQITNLPDKVFGVNAYGIDISKDRAEQLYSHVEYGIQNGHAATKQWHTARWYPGMSAADTANSLPKNSSFLWASQIAEDRGNAGYIYDFGFVDQVQQLYFAGTGQADPANTNIIQDYFDANGVLQIGLSALMQPTGASYWNNWRQKFSNETEARKNRDGGQIPFIARGSHNWSNWLGYGYLDGWHRVPEHSWPYLHIAEIEQMHLAVRRKVIQFAWDMFEGAEWKIYAQASFQGIRFENPAGFIYKAIQNNQPPEMMYRQGITTHLWGDGVVHWGPAGRTTSDQSRWVRSYTGGYSPSKTLWKGDGSAFASNYDFNNPTHPKKSPGDNPNNYTGDNVELVPPIFGGPAPYGAHNSLGGRHMVSRMRAIDGGIMKWPPFSYKINNGSTINGYYNGQNPRMGVLGDASISTLDNRNFQQDNIIYQLEYKKPICVHNNSLVVWCNPLARPNEANQVTLGDGTTFTSVGPSMKVYQK